MKKVISTLLGTSLLTLGLLTGCANQNQTASPSASRYSAHSIQQNQHSVKLSKGSLSSQVSYVLEPTGRLHSAQFAADLKQNIYYTNQVLVISFHDMSSHLNSLFNMSPVLFSEDLQALNQYHFHVISNEQYTKWLNHQSRVPNNAVLLTFDDGYRSMYTHAYPTLLHYHMTGTFFDIVHAQDVNFPGFLSWQEVQVMARHGMTVESHTYNEHYEVPVNGRLIPVFNTPYYQGKQQTYAQWFTRDYKDFLTARLELQQHLGYSVNELAWPYGYGSNVAYLAARAAGYRYFFTTSTGIDTVRTSSWYMHRIDVGLAKSPQQMINLMLQTANVPLRLSPLSSHSMKLGSEHASQWSNVTPSQNSSGRSGHPNPQTLVDRQTLI